MHSILLVMMTQQQFTETVESFIKATGTTPTAFGKAAMRDPTFVFGLRAGRSCSLNTVEKVITFIKANDPEPHP